MTMTPEKSKELLKQLAALFPPTKSGKPALAGMGLKEIAALVHLSPETREALYRELTGKNAAEMPFRKLYSYYPDEGPLRRELYSKHLEFFSAGAHYKERALVAGNRTGKSFAVCYELTCHLIGYYPHWWQGRKFEKAVIAWASGEDAKAVRESLQVTLMGQPGELGTGSIPRENIITTTNRPGVPDAFDSVTIKHSGGGQSRLVFKTYDQGRESYQAAAIDIGVCDEEPPMNIYTELLTRCMSVTPGQPNGIVMCAFTPLKGLSSVVLSYLPHLKPSDTEVSQGAW